MASGVTTLTLLHKDVDTPWLLEICQLALHTFHYLPSSISNMYSALSKYHRLVQDAFPASNRHRAWTILDAADRVRSARLDSHMGYPFHILPTDVFPAGLKGDSHINIGKPSLSWAYGGSVMQEELDIVEFYAKICAAEPGRVQGYVTSGGTEGNIQAFNWWLSNTRYGLDAGDRLVFICTRDAHYSALKAATSSQVQVVLADSNPDGSMSLEHLESVVEDLGGCQVFLFLTCGTTFTGAFDDIRESCRIVAASPIGRRSCYIHVDAALSGLILPFVDSVPDSIQPTFKHDVDSISVSAHKMLGVPSPCGVLIAKREHVEGAQAKVSYIDTYDTTLLGSRDGRSIRQFWFLTQSMCISGYSRLMQECLDRTAAAVIQLRLAGVVVSHSRFSTTVVIPKPHRDIVRHYQLAPQEDKVHFIVMPNVLVILDEFLQQYLEWYQMEKE